MEGVDLQAVKTLVNVIEAIDNPAKEAVNYFWATEDFIEARVRDA